MQWVYHLANRVSDLLVNVVEHLAMKEIIPYGLVGAKNTAEREINI